MSNKISAIALAGAAFVALVAAPIVSDARPSGGGGGRATASNRAPSNVGNGNRGNVNTGNVNSGNRNNVNNGNVNSGNRTNINNGNVRVGNDININVDNDWDHGYHPVARGVATGVAIGVTTRAVIGARYYALPAGCVTRTYSTVYYYCGTVWYAPQYQGTTVQYVVVNPPG